MPSGQPCGEKSTKGPLVAGNSVENVGHIPGGITDYSDMLRLGAELHRDVADLDRIAYF